MNSISWSEIRILPWKTFIFILIKLICIRFPTFRNSSQKKSAVAIPRWKLKEHYKVNTSLNTPSKSDGNMHLAHPPLLINEPNRPSRRSRYIYTRRICHSPSFQVPARCQRCNGRVWICRKQNQFLSLHFAQKEFHFQCYIRAYSPDWTHHFFTINNRLFNVSNMFINSPRKLIRIAFSKLEIFLIAFRTSHFDKLN